MENNPKLIIQAFIAPQMAELLCNRVNYRCINVVTIIVSILELIAFVLMLISRVMIIQHLLNDEPEGQNGEGGNGGGNGGEQANPQAFVPNGHIARPAAEVNAAEVAAAQDEGEEGEEEEPVVDEEEEEEEEDGQANNEEYNQQFGDVVNNMVGCGNEPRDKKND